MRIITIFLAAGILLGQTPSLQPAIEGRVPKWLKLSGELRSRAEGRTGFNFQPENDDAYILARVRLNVSLVPTPWLEVSFQGQDSRAPGLDDSRPPGIYRDPADIRQAYIRLGGVDYHWLWLASPNDALYDVAGRATVRPRTGSTARSIGTELDATITWSARQWKAGGGIGHLFAGEFLKQNSPGSGQTFPYVFAQYSF